LQLSTLAGRAEIMDFIATGQVARVGTFNSRPVAVAAAQATLTVLDKERNSGYPTLSLGRRLAGGLCDAATQVGMPLLVGSPSPVIQTDVTEAAQGATTTSSPLPTVRRWPACTAC
jgi:glutamate-1-semialdehyde 2,1-aminomutase